MKHIILTGALMLTNAMIGEAMADCTNNRVHGGNALRTLLSGNTVCQASGADKLFGAQEQHRANGTLWEYAKGDDPVDPTTEIGRWRASGGTNAEVTYDYLGGNSFTYAVYKNENGGYDFCDGANQVATVTIVNGITHC